MYNEYLRCFCLNTDVMCVLYISIFKMHYSYLVFFLFRWEVDDWGPCSKTCGGGFRERKVSCVSDRGGKKIKVREIKLIKQN